jgi:hypothetical protein
MTSGIHYRQHGDLTVRHIEGSPAFEELEEAIRQNYRSPTSNVCWVLLPGASAKHLNVKQAKELALLTGSLAEETPGVKSAIVAPEHFEYAMGRIIETHSGLLGLPFDVKVFRTRGEAADWLGVDPEALAL